MKTGRNTYSMDESLGYWLYRSHIRVSAALRQTFQHAGYNLTPEQWSVLFRLYEQEGMNQSQLGEKTGKDRHNITRILKQLARRCYIVRQDDKKDKRAHRIYLTRNGRDLCKKIVPLMLRHRDRICRGFKTKDLIYIRSYLEQVVHNSQNAQNNQ
jgi:DNA-binding MarR family transcriptional regulator